MPCERLCVPACGQLDGAGCKKDAGRTPLGVSVKQDGRSAHPLLRRDGPRLMTADSDVAAGDLSLDACLTGRLPRFMAIARSMLGNEQDVEDVVQDVAVRAIAARRSFRGDSDVCTWVHRILVNRCNDLIASRVRRRQAVTDEAFDELWADPGYTVDPTVVEALVADREELTDALARLSPAQRSVVVLHDAHGWKLRDIAELIDAPLPTVKSHLRRGRRAMVTLLGDAGR